MKRWKFIRANLANLGYTTLASTEGITITNIDSDGWLYYTDEHGDQLKVLYPATTPIVVNSDTSTITVTVTNYLAGVSGYTAATVVTNENDLVVTPECTFATGDATIFTTGGTYGETLIAVGSGTTTLTVIHNDGDTISGTTTITVGTVIVDGDFGPNPTGETISSVTTYNVSDVWYSNGQNIPFNINYYSVSEQIATLDLSTGIITPTATGTTVINITDEASGFDSSTGFTLNISVPGWINIDTSPLIFDAAGTDGKRLVEFSSEVQVETTGMFGVSAEADIEEDPDNLGTYFLMWGAEQNDTGGTLTGTITISLIDDPTVFVTINAEQESI